MSSVEGEAEATVDRLIDEGNVLEDQGRLNEALALYERAVQVAPTLARGHINVGNVRSVMGDLFGAINAYRRGLAHQPQHAGCHYNLGLALLSARQLEPALAALDRALALKPEMVDAVVTRAAVLEDLGRKGEAEQALRTALEMRPHAPEVWKNFARLLSSESRHDEAIVALEHAMALQPDDLDAEERWIAARMAICDWEGLDVPVARLFSAIERGRPPTSPFRILTLSTNDDLPTQAARQFLGSLPRVSPFSPRVSALPADRKIRVGYLSADFRNHPVATLIAGLIESHDRTRFDVSGWSLGADDGGDLRQRLRRAFDRFIDVEDQSDANIAARIGEAEIDVLIDLTVHTTGGRPGLLAYRAAPVQVNWLGYPGSFGAPWVDYLIADRNIIPPDARESFFEQIVWLPNSYFCEDQRRPMGRSGTRRDAGLPEDGVVFCAFHNFWKIRPDVFSGWMRVLSKVPNSVLWLRDYHSTARSNLRTYAANAGVDPGRLIFADSQPAADHLARHALADLYLDTFPYNAHSTASDALYAGLPVITCRGGSFPGRVASSLLHSVGLPELIVDTLNQYEALAVQLGTDRRRLTALRYHLLAGRERFPLFDTVAFTHHFEACLSHMVRRQRQGLAPAAFAVCPDCTIVEVD